MLEFINSNGVLFSGICSIIVALISVIVSVWRDNKKNRTDTIRSLRKELDETKEELEKTNAKILELSSVEKKKEILIKLMVAYIMRIMKMAVLGQYVVIVGKWNI